MKLLWTIANWKWTGPVAPSLDLARAVADAGHEVLVEVGRPPSHERCEAGVLRSDRGLAEAGVGARLHKHAFLLRDLPDVRRLASWIHRERPDAVVTTLANDHRLALAAAGDVPVVRLLFADGSKAPAPRELRSLRRTERIFVFGQSPQKQLETLGVARERIAKIDPPLDVRRLAGQVDDPAAFRSELGVGPDTCLFGIVARLQRHRRYEMLWDAIANLKAREVPFHVAVLGRGTYQEEVGRQPVERLGLGDVVTFAGYRRGEAYATAVAAFDAQVFLVPGSDPTCRALREGLTLGAAGLTTRRGLLPDLVEDGRSGWLVDETEEAFADAMTRMATDLERTRRMGAEAARLAAARFDAGRVAGEVLHALGEVVRG